MLPTPVRGEENGHQTQIPLLSIASCPYIRLLRKASPGHSQIIKWSLCSCSVPFPGRPGPVTHSSAWLLWRTVLGGRVRSKDCWESCLQSWAGKVLAAECSSLRNLREKSTSWQSLRTYPLQFCSYVYSCSWHGLWLPILPSPPPIFF